MTQMTRQIANAMESKENGLLSSALYNKFSNTKFREIKKRHILIKFHVFTCFSLYAYL